ncbi:hypothetical protein B0A52_01759 [Exophiala mesophila]|uniref:COP9 signalosome complex subunit 1 n=1 Tax=Exophiala mesophila TaxID=212818 RepID=A0A438NFY1_EXOME|nr:hypothetical protein B0A52_01759 [Exophiala mesophila]
MANDSQRPEPSPYGGLIVNETPKFDLQSYISNYRGRTVFRRLHLIASCSPVLAEEASRLAVLEAKKGSDVRNYTEAAALYKKVARDSSADVLDPTWATKQEKKNNAETARLENELKGYKNNLIKESIRMGNEDLGTHYHSIGDLNNALKAYSRMRDYCTTPAHIASTAFRIISVSIEQKSWLAVNAQVTKIQNLQMKADDNTRNVPKTYAAVGLNQMASAEYRLAANSFLNCDASLGDSYNDVLTSNDVAVYGGLCALASMSRAELQTKVLENANFRNFLELEPHIRRAITCFCASKYSQCLEILESYRADYLLDLYLQPVITDLYNKMRTKSIIQYFQPFSKVTLANMEKIFGSPAPVRAPTGNKVTQQTFIEEIISLIETGKLEALIDLEYGTLNAIERDPRAEAQEEALNMIDAFTREARLKLIRLQALTAGLEVKFPVRKQRTWDAEDDLGGYGDNASQGPSGLTSGGGDGLQSFSQKVG